MTLIIVINYFNKIKKFVVLFVFFLFSISSIAGSYEDFFIALQNDQVKVVSNLLSRGFDPNTVNLKAEPALLNALNVGALTSAEVLVRHPKINVNVRNAHGETALMLACLKGHVALAKLLITKQADINQPGWTPLHYAATGGHVVLIQLLLEESAYIDAESPNGTTPLMMAARYGSAKATQLLIDEGADLQVKNQLGLTALDFAKQGNRPDAFEIISKAMSQLKTDPKNQ
jgi:ankyrin repeat protein